MQLCSFHVSMLRYTTTCTHLGPEHVYWRRCPSLYFTDNHFITDFMKGMRDNFNYSCQSSFCSECILKCHTMLNGQTFRFFPHIIGVGVSSYCTTISLICMSSHKASATRCLSKHQAWSRQPAIRALPQLPLRRLALSVLFTIATTSYQTTCTVSETIKGTRQSNYRV